MHENFKEKLIEFQKEIQNMIDRSLSCINKVSGSQGKKLHDSILQLSNLTFAELTEIAGKYTKWKILYSKEVNRIKTIIDDCIKDITKSFEERRICRRNPLRVARKAAASALEKKKIKAIALNLKKFSKYTEKHCTQLVNDLTKISAQHCSKLVSNTKEIAKLSSSMACKACDLLEYPQGKIVNDVIIGFTSSTLCHNGLCIPIEELRKMQSVICNLLKQYEKQAERIGSDIGFTVRNKPKRQNHKKKYPLKNKTVMKPRRKRKK